MVDPRELTFGGEDGYNDHERGQSLGFNVSENHFK